MYYIIILCHYICHYYCQWILNIWTKNAGKDIRYNIHVCAMWSYKPRHIYTWTIRSTGYMFFICLNRSMCNAHEL